MCSQRKIVITDCYLCLYSNVRQLLGVMVNFMYQSHWPRWCPDTAGETLFRGMTVFLEEIWTGELSKQMVLLIVYRHRPILRGPEKNKKTQEGHVHPLCSSWTSFFSCPWTSVAPGSLSLNLNWIMSPVSWVSRLKTVYQTTFHLP